MRMFGRWMVWSALAVVMLGPLPSVATNPGGERIAQRANAPADLNLIIAIDCSYSVDEFEFNLQIAGTANAFASDEVIRAITDGRHGRIAVSVIQWSAPESQVVSVPWTVVSNAADAVALAGVIAKQTRQTADGATSMTALIDFALTRFALSPVVADRNAIDISADGINNKGGRVDNARDRAVFAGVTINGLPILNERSWLNYYFENHVIGGDGAFIEIANDYSAYAEAIRKKLLREIKGSWTS